MSSGMSATGGGLPVLGLKNLPDPSCGRTFVIGYLLLRCVGEEE